jgi:hypothetical protein
MHRLACLLALASACGSDYEVPAPPDMRVSLDLSTNLEYPPPDMTCFNTACGGCSEWARPDGTPAMVGDPCLWNGTLACTGDKLTCSSTACPACGSPMAGSVCGKDGKTIVSITYDAATCVAYSFGSAINVCNRTADDKCLGRCVLMGGTYHCSAHCASAPDGGGPGCEHQDSDTCASLAGC